MECVINMECFFQMWSAGVIFVSSQGKHTEARHHYEIAAKFDADNPTLKQNLAKLQRVVKKKSS